MATIANLFTHHLIPQPPQKPQIPKEPQLLQPTDSGTSSTGKPSNSQTRLEEINIRLEDINNEIWTIRTEQNALNEKIKDFSENLKKLPNNQQGLIMKNSITMQIAQLLSKKTVLESKLLSLEKEKAELETEKIVYNLAKTQKTAELKTSRPLASIILAKQQQAEAEIALIEKREIEVNEKLELLEAKKNQNEVKLNQINTTINRIEKIIEQYEANPRQTLHVKILTNELERLNIEANELEVMISAIETEEFHLQEELKNLHKSKKQWESQLFM